MSEAMSLNRCNGFPPFIRLSGAFYQAGAYGGYGGNFGNRHLMRPQASVNAEPGAFFFLLNPSFNAPLGPLDPRNIMTVTPVPVPPVLPDVGLRYVQTFIGTTSLAGEEWESEFFPVRQQGWTGGIYTHTVNQLIRRRSGPALANCSYFRCIRKTDEIITSGGVRIIGNRGEDPATLPDYWLPITVGFVDSDSVNTFMVGSFMDDPRNLVLGDYKMMIGAGGAIPSLHLVVREQMLAPHSRSAPNVFTGDPETYNNLEQPFPEHVRCLCSANYVRNGNAWNRSNPQFNNPALNFDISWTAYSVQPTKLKAGFFVRETGFLFNDVHVWRVNNEINYPPAGTPEANGMTDLGTMKSGRAIFPPNAMADRDLPSRYSNGAKVSGSQVTSRTFTQRQRFDNWSTRTRYFSMMGPNQLSVRDPAAEFFYHSISLGCNGVPTLSALRPTFPQSLAEHPLREPTKNVIVKTGNVGTCRLYRAHLLTVNDGVNKSVQWIGDAPVFIHPGQYIEVQFFTSPAAGAPYVNDITIRYYSGILSWFPLPRGDWWTDEAGGPTLFRLQNLPFAGWAATQITFSTYQFFPAEAVPTVYTQPGSISGTIQSEPDFEITDTRSLAELPAVSANLIELDSINTVQTYRYSANLSWCRIRAFPKSQPGLTLPMYNIDGTPYSNIQPMIQMQTELRLTEANTCV